MGPSWASWTDRSVIRGFLAPSRGPLRAPSWASLGHGEVAREHSGGPGGRAGGPQRFESSGPGPAKNPQAWGPRLRGLSKGPGVASC
eukprot:3290763-Pyramimonas_sp.AAC.1